MLTSTSIPTSVPLAIPIKNRIVVDGNNAAYIGESKNKPVTKKLVLLYQWLKNTYGLEAQIFIS